MVVDRHIINNILKKRAIRKISEIKKLDRKEINRQLDLLNFENVELKEKIDAYPKYLNIISPFFEEIGESLKNINRFSESNIKFQQIEKRGLIFKGKVWDLISIDNDVSRYFEHLNELIEKFKNYEEMKHLHMSTDGT